MRTGKVKWFNNAKGYGFILCDSLEGELFAHFSSILSEGYKSLRAGQDVQFETQQGPKGLHAINIRPLDQ
ncbi:cold shock domain-containing protein [Nitrincola tapanii]|jgi:cold shock protein|uniref:Cold shock domain protein CspD n=1 Tax=Nitrincola tapanii TaxID=1708751 RepID=A0A5A9W3N9_9GAMM|nr:cold shock domain-containing protein [Nitrincola tapanii]KAA0875390.1 cold shock domain protein CspD [Nitrincola tapanii]